MRQNPAIDKNAQPFFRIFKIIACLFGCFFYLYPLVLAQETRHASVSNNQTVKLKDALFEVESHFDVSILYRSEIVEGLLLHSNFVFEETIHQTLEKLLQPFGLQYQEINENTFVVLSPKPSITKDKGTVKGRITDINGAPMEGVNVVLKGTKIGAPTDSDGKFEIRNVALGSHVLCSSYVGFLSRKETVVVQPNVTTEVNVFLNEDFLELKNVVVTGSRNNISKIESSIALTTINASFLEKIAPRSTADVLQYIPGFYSESSGGETTNNLFSRGMSAEGSFQYVVLQEDGLPVYEAGNIDWASSDNFTRVDLSLKKVEALRGGSGNIFASNAPGGIINFISYTGEEHLTANKPKGKIRLQTSDFGQFRTDANLGGKLTDNIFFNIGGFYRRDDGIRQPGYTANNGGQIKANMTKKINNGYIRLYAKYLNEKNIFYLPIPLINASKPKPVNHFNANYGTMNALKQTVVSFPTPEGAKTYDLTDGARNHLGYIGTEMSFKILKDWTVTNKNRISYIYKGTDAIISVFEPISAQKYAKEKMANISDATSYNYSYSNGSDVFDEKFANGNGLVGEQGWWHNDLQLKSVINSLEISKKSDDHIFTTGVYLSEFSDKTQRHWANLLLEVRDDNAQRLNLDFYNRDGELISTVTHNGFTTYQAFNIWENNTGKARVLAVFADEQWTINPHLSLNAGLRYETLSASGSLENTDIFDLNPSNSTYRNPVLSEILFGNNTFDYYGWSFNDFAASLGLNYNITKDMSAYARTTKGYRMPDFDNWQARQSDGGQTEDVLLLESGYKYSAPKIAFFGALFFTSISNQLTTDNSIDTLGNVLPFRTRGSQTIGTELEVTSRPIKNLRVDVKATLQQATYKVADSQELPNLPPIDGNQVKRIPNVFFTLMPSYEYRTLKFFGTIQYFGNRFSDETNTANLPAFTNLNIGVSVSTPLKSQRVISFLVHAQNLTNTIGLTEGNPRIIGTRATSTRLARPILGRSVIVSSTLSF
ncbi:MAG: TonB-dependent receptor [Chitinophagales bacterium]